MQSILPSLSLRVFLLRLVVVLIVFAGFLSIRMALNWDENARQAMLRNVDNGMTLGKRTAEAIGDYVLKNGKYPSGLDSLPAGIGNTTMANVALSPNGDEAEITLVNKRVGIDGKRMYFRPEFANGKVGRIACRTADEAFRKRIEGRCD